MNEIFTIAGIGIVAAGLIIIFKQYRPEFAFGTALAFGIILLIYSIILFTDIFDEIKGLTEISGIGSENFKILFRCLGICFITKTASEICSDCGQNSVATKIDFAGKTTILLSAIPLYSEITDIIKNLISL